MHLDYTYLLIPKLRRKNCRHQNFIIKHFTFSLASTKPYLSYFLHSCYCNGNLSSITILPPSQYFLFFLFFFFFEMSSQYFLFFFFSHVKIGKNDQDDAWYLVGLCIFVFGLNTTTAFRVTTRKEGPFYWSTH